MISFDLVESIWEEFTNNNEIVSLLGISSEREYRSRVRLQNVQPEEYNASQLPFITIYFLEADMTYNYLVNSGYLCIEIYSDDIETAIPLAKRILKVMHDKFDLRLKAEGQYHSGISNVYKYRFVFNPLIST